MKQIDYLETDSQKNERHIARKYLRGFINHPELLDIEIHKKAYEYAKKLQIETIKKINTQQYSVEDILFVLDTLLIIEDKRDNDKMSVADMNNFAVTRKQLL